MYIVCIYTFTKNCSCASWKNDFPHDLICLLVLITDFSLLSMCVCVLSRFSCVWLFVILWTVAHQAPLSMSFSRQEYWSGLPCPPQGRCSYVQFSQYFLVRWSLYILFFSEGYFQIFFFGNFLFQHLKYVIPLSPGPLGFCWEIFLDPNEASLVNSGNNS